MATPITINFDDIILSENGEVRLQDGYAGFNWGQAGVHNPDGNLGYRSASGENTAFIAEANGNEVQGYEEFAPGTPFVISRAESFDFLSADFSAAFRSGLAITVQAFADAAGTISLGSVTITADQGVTSNFSFDPAIFSNVQRIEFNANDGNAGTSDYFGIDNITYQERPVISTVNFDDFELAPGGETPIADGYEGFQWSGVGAYRPDGAIPGYQATSGNSIGFIGEANGNEIAGYEEHVAGTAAVLIRDDAFTFVGGDFSAAFRNDLDLTIRAFADAEGQVLLGTANVQIDQGAQSLNFSGGANVVGTFEGARRLEFASNDNNGGTSDYFGFDSLQFIL